VVSTASKPAPISQNVTQDAAGNASTQRSLVSRLSSQSIVLFLILAIAIMGIVIGNRGGEDGTDAGSSLKETLLTETTAPVDAVGSTEKLIEPAIGVTDSEANQTAPQKSTSTKHADLAVKPSSQSLSADVGADLHESVVGDDADVLEQNEPTRTSNETAPVPRSGTQDALVVEPVQEKTVPEKNVPAENVAAENDPENKPSASVAVLGTPASDEPSSDQVTTSAAAVPSDKASSSTASTSGYTQTQTPAGVSDWLLYLPSVNGELQEPGTLAVSATPQSPIANYQQYLDSLIQSESQTTTPVGYLQDSDSGLPNTTTGTQAQLSVPTNTTQRR
jgi:hypothetical protein